MVNAVIWWLSVIGFIVFYLFALLTVAILAATRFHHTQNGMRDTQYFCVNTIMIINLVVTCNATIILAMPTVLGYTQMFQENFANQENFKASIWYYICRICYANTYTLSFIQFSLMVYHLYILRKSTTMASRVTTIYDWLFVGVIFAVGITFGMAVHISDVHFIQLPGEKYEGFYQLKSDSEWLSTVVYTLIGYQVLCLLVGVVLQVLTHWGLKMHSVGNATIKVMWNRYTFMSILLTFAMLLGLAITVSIRIAIDVKSLNSWLPPACLTLPLVSNLLSNIVTICLLKNSSAHQETMRVIFRKIFPCWGSVQKLLCCKSKVSPIFIVAPASSSRAVSQFAQSSF